MSKRPYCRTSLGKQRVGGYEKVLKSARHHYYRMFPQMWDKLSWKGFLLVRSEFLGLFLTHWLPSTSIPVAIWRISRNNFKRSFLRNEKLFLDFLLRFLNVHVEFLEKTWNIFLDIPMRFWNASMLKHFETKDEPSSLSISEINDPKWSGTYTSKRS